jgi:hypothetical protein
VNTLGSRRRIYLERVNTFMFLNRLQSALSGVESALAKRAKVREAIASQIGKLTALLGTLQGAQRALEDVMAAEAIDEAGAGDVAKSKKRVAGIQNEIASISETLAGLRRSMARLGPELAKEHAKLSEQMPEHHAQLKSDFLEEFRVGVEKFSQLLGKAQALQELLQEHLDLPMPAPIAANLGALATPDLRLRESAEAITLAGAPPPYDLPGVPKQFFYDSSRIYQLRKDFTDPSGPGLPAGTLISDASFETGWTRHLVEVGDAITANDPVVQASADSARRLQVAQSRIESEALMQTPSPSGRVM